MNAVIEATGLVMKYKDVVALDGLDLSVAEGTRCPLPASGKNG